jgi:NADH:ubiquinone oxidoreductase subunit 6 (subunit J)
VGEDVLAIFLVWFSTQHPVLAATIVVALLVAIVIVLRWVVQALRSLFRGAEREVAQLQVRG